MPENRGFHYHHHGENNYQPHNNSAKPPALIADRLTKLLGMTGSAHDAEALAACRKANQLLRQHNLTWADLLVPSAEPPRAESRDQDGWVEPMTWADAVTFCAAYSYRLTERDAAFIGILTAYTACPSQRQLRWLQDVVGKLMAMGITP